MAEDIATHSSNRWEVHIFMESSWPHSQWRWTAQRAEQRMSGWTETRWGAKRAAKRFCKNPNPPEKPDRYDFTFTYRP